MKNRYINIIVFCLSMVLGLMIMAFYNTSTNVLNNDIVSKKKLDSLKNELEIAEADKRELLEKIDSLKNDVQGFEDLMKRTEENYEKLSNELKNYKVHSGGFDVSGPGIIINISEPSSGASAYDAGSLTYDYYYILSIVSYLNSAGAEAISINDQRYTSYTEIVPVGNYLNINGKNVVSPIEIKAIGDARTLDSAINFVGGVVEQMKYMGFEIEVTESSDVKISAISKIKEFQFAVPFESETE